MINSPAKVIALQTLLYEVNLDCLTRFFDCLAACEVPPGYKLLVYVGDCSAQPLPDGAFLDHWDRELSKKDIRLSYSFFKQNLGFARGHNTLYRQAAQPSDLLLVLNPDIVFPFH